MKISIIMTFMSKKRLNPDLGKTHPDPQPWLKGDNSYVNQKVVNQA